MLRKERRPMVSRIALLPLLAAVSGVSPMGEEKAVAGQPVPDFEFRTVLGGDGRKSLSEFRGQPVLRRTATRSSW
jgi:hypothetical protein